MKSVSILIPALNEEQTLTRLLPFLVQAVELNSCITEVLLVSSPSTDRTAELCSSATRGWSFIKHLALTEWVPKFNVLARGSAEAKNDWLIVMDADVQASCEMLATLASHTSSEPRIVQARNVPDCLERIQATNSENVPIQLLWAALTSLAWHWIRSNRHDLRWAVSAHCYLCHRSVFPTNCPARFPDDMSIGLNCWNSGFPILYAPEIRVIFRPAQTLSDFLRQKLRNRIALAHMRKVAPEKIGDLRSAFRSCLSNGSCVEEFCPRSLSFPIKTLLALDAVLWQTAKVLAIAGFGSRGRWRAAGSTKQCSTP